MVVDAAPIRPAGGAAAAKDFPRLGCGQAQRLEGGSRRRRRRPPVVQGIAGETAALAQAAVGLDALVSEAGCGRGELVEAALAGANEALDAPEETRHAPKKAAAAVAGWPARSAPSTLPLTPEALCSSADAGHHSAGRCFR